MFCELDQEVDFEMRMSGAMFVAGAIVCGLAISGTQPVYAGDGEEKKVRKSFFQRIFKKQPRQTRKERARLEEAQRKRNSAKKIRISRPKIFTYRPDVLKTVSLAKLAEVEVASADTSADVIGRSATDNTISTTDKTMSPFELARGHLSSVEIRAMKQVVSALTTHYSHNPNFIWITNGQINSKAQAALETLAKADTVGLSSDDYRFEFALDATQTASITQSTPVQPNQAEPQSVTVTENSDETDISPVAASEDGTAESKEPATLDVVDNGSETVVNSSELVLPATQSQTVSANQAAPLQTDEQVSPAKADAIQAPSNTAPGIVEESFDEARQKHLMEFEMRLSAKVLTYILDARRGRIDPNRLSGYHDLPRHKVDLVAALEELAASEDVSLALEGHHPDNAAFSALKAELAALQDREEEALVVIAEGTLIKPGKTHLELANVVAGIALRGSDKLKADHAETLAAYSQEELYSPELVALVKEFQTESKLTPDGVIGQNTISALTGITNADKVRKINLAMERVRWLPRDLGERHVFINQPAYNATYFDPNKDPLSMRVVVGKKSNQTNFFYDEIETVEFNPYWGVPLSIIVNEMMPKLRNDPYYLDNAGYEVTTIRGERISSASVDWYSVATKALPINVRQPPGRKNALGSLKILFPNKHAIYMHDTPAKSLFKRDRRAYSHGCIRLQYPDKMAAAVLGKTTDYVSSRIAGGQNESDRVAGNIPVYSSYFTAWPTLEKSIGYYDDVYGRDKHLSKALDSTIKARRTSI